MQNTSFPLQAEVNLGRNDTAFQLFILKNKKSFKWVLDDGEAHFQM